jgi:primosomal protein N' (replication factor Y)
MKVPVLITKIFNHPFTYNSKPGENFKQGDIVVVPFGNKKEIGVVWDKIHPTNKKIKIKNIEYRINEFNLNKSLIKFINWFSMYNISSKGIILKMCLGDKKNILKNDKIEIRKNTKIKKYSLNLEQKKSLKDLKKNGNSFNVTVLQGITGSGKTLVYFERIRQIIKDNKQALIMLPEIFLTNQFKDRFTEYFGYEPSIWHSKISPKKKRNIWQGVINNKLNLVIGARSSLLLPFKNLGIIIVDEEHDSSYKQEERLIYNARDMAISRASFENIPIHLVSSIPSLETFNHIQSKKYNLTKLKKRYINHPLPDAKIINLNFSKLNKDEFITSETIKLVKKYLDKKDQILFFLNRRGYAPFMICKKCGFKHVCSNCAVYLTYHKSIDKLICHHCGLKKKKNNKCNIQGEECDFTMYGPGVEKIYDELKIKFPQKIIKIFSSDFLNVNKKNIDLIKEVENNKINILVGTQMISKGFNFPKLNCIVVVDADFSGKGYDLRSTEKNIQLYNQLSGRAGRFSKKSLIIYQTMTPTDKTLKNVISNNPENFLSNEILLRQENKLPPFYRLIALIISANEESDSFRGAQQIKLKLLGIKDIEVLGPVYSPILRIKKNYRTRLLIRIKKNNLIQKKVGQVLENLQISKKIKLTVDVDPINFN